MLAGKFNESIKPAFVNMNHLLLKEFTVSVSKRDFLMLEEEILRALEFDM